MKLSFNKSSKSIITSYINKANYSQSQKEIKYNNSTKNLGKEIINLNYKTKRNVNTISPLKNNSFYKQPNTLFHHHIGNLKMTLLVLNLSHKQDCSIGCHLHSHLLLSFRLSRCSINL